MNDDNEVHEHEWQPNGIIEVHREACSPCSRLDDVLWTEMLSVAVCRCGKVKRVRVGSKNERHRGDGLRRASR